VVLALLPAAGGGGDSNAPGGGSGTGGTVIGTIPVPPCVSPPTGTPGGGVTPFGTGGLQVTTASGTIEGSLNDSARAFLGVRYAAPPTGCLRFSSPREAVFVSGITPTQAMPPRCIQIFNGSTLGDEDCLFLNVWAPNDTATHPVMVWLHGGNINALDGSKLAAATGAIVVAPNRRVGILGTMSLQQLADEAPDHSTGTYAVQDTIAALRWVQRNISAFGGDPARVMVIGSSAGGSIACSLVAAPSARGMFSAVAVMSGVCHPRFVVDASLSRYSTAPPLKTVHAPLIAATACNTASSTLDCLRNLPTQKLLDAAASLPALPGGGPAVPFAPIIDGVVVVSDPYSALEKQVAGNFRLVAGSTSDEMRSLLTLPAMDDTAYRSFLRDRYGASAEALYALYSPNAYLTPTDAAYMLLSDAVFGCPAEALARAASTNRPAHLYLFSRNSPTLGYAPHGGEYPYLFDLLEQVGITVDQTALDLRSAVQSAWARLASAPQTVPLVDAGGRGSFSWPEYSFEDARFLDLGDPVQIGSSYRGGRCAQLIGLDPP
jgi:para-nitrobenzyl esterase